MLTQTFGITLKKTIASIGKDFFWFIFVLINQKPECKIIVLFNASSTRGLGRVTRVTDIILKLNKEERLSSHYTLPMISKTKYQLF